MNPEIIPKNHGLKGSLTDEEAFHLLNAPSMQTETGGKAFLDRIIGQEYVGLRPSKQN